jgi:hypothetical protein
MINSLKTVISTIFLLLLNVSCQNNGATKVVLKTKIIDLGTLKPFGKDTSISYYNISLLKAYPSHQPCTGDDRYVNLWVCRNDNTRDTLLVFQPCKPVPDFLTDNSSVKSTLSFANADVQEKHPQSILVNVPANFKLTGRLQYVFVPLKILSE